MFSLKTFSASTVYRSFVYSSLRSGDRAPVPDLCQDEEQARSGRKTSYR